MMNAVIPLKARDAGGIARPERRRRLRLIALLLLLSMVAGLGCCWLYRETKVQRAEFRVLRKSLERVVAPGETVVVDDRLLGWALQHGGDRKGMAYLVQDDGGGLNSLRGVWPERGREIVVVARPQARLLEMLRAGGYEIREQPGVAPWDTRGLGRGMLGRAKVRIFFVVLSASGPAAPR